MDKAFYKDMQGTADELLGFFGVTATITNPEGRGTGSGLAVLTSPKIQSSVDGQSYVMSTQKVVYFQAKGKFTPETGAVVRFGKSNYVVSGVEGVNPDDSTPIVFKLMVAV